MTVVYAVKGGTIDYRTADYLQMSGVIKGRDRDCDCTGYMGLAYRRWEWCMYVVALIPT